MIDIYDALRTLSAMPKLRRREMKFTWWGGLLGPKLLTHVKCQACGKQYNGKTGKENTTNIVIYFVVVGVICLALVVGLFAALGILMVATR